MLVSSKLRLFPSHPLQLYLLLQTSGCLINTRHFNYCFEHELFYSLWLLHHSNVSCTDGMIGGWSMSWSTYARLSYYYPLELGEKIMCMHTLLNLCPFWCILILIICQWPRGSNSWETLSACLTSLEKYWLQFCMYSCVYSYTCTEETK